MKHFRTVLLDILKMPCAKSRHPRVRFAHTKTRLESLISVRLLQEAYVNIFGVTKPFLTVLLQTLLRLNSNFTKAEAAMHI